MTVLTWALLGAAIGLALAYPTARLARDFHLQLDPEVPYSPWEGRFAAALCPLFGLLIGGRYAGLALATPLPALLAGLGAWVGVIILVVDWRTRYIPDRLQYPAIVLALVLRTLIDGGPLGSLTGLAIGLVFWGAIYAVATAVYHSSEAFGLGDVKLGAFIGAALGPYFGLVAFVVGMTLGAIFAAVYLAARWGDRRSPIAYGPFMVSGLLVVLLVLARGAFGHPV